MQKYFGIIFSIIVGIFSLLLVVLPKNDFSENENRVLANIMLPTTASLLNGDFMKEFESYVQDHFPFRYSFLKQKAIAELLLLKTENNNVYFSKDNYMIEKPITPNYKNLERISKVLNVFKEKINANCYILLAPTSISINDDKLPQFATYTNEQEIIQYIYDKTQGYTKIYCLQALRNQNATVPMYYRYDHHWTTRGAYTAYEEFMKIKNDTATPLDEYNKETVSNNFLGTVYSKVNIAYTTDKIDTYTHKTDNYSVHYVDSNKLSTSMYNKEYLNKKDKYSMFLDNNQSLIVISNENATNNNKLLVIKDSYANSFIPFVASNYKQVHVIDLRYYTNKLSSYIEQEKFNDVLFLYNIKTIQDDMYIYTIE